MKTVNNQKRLNLGDLKKLKKAHFNYIVKYFLKEHSFEKYNRLTVIPTKDITDAIEVKNQLIKLYTNDYNIEVSLEPISNFKFEKSNVYFLDLSEAFYERIKNPGIVIFNETLAIN